MEILNITQATFAMTKPKQMAEIIRSIKEGNSPSELTIGGLYVGVSTTSTNYAYTVMEVLVDKEGTKHFTPVAMSSDVMQTVGFIIRRNKYESILYSS